MRKLILLALLVSSAAMAAGVQESWTVEGKTFESKAMAVRYVMSLGRKVEVQHNRCEILTNKLTFKACPKAKMAAFDNAQFDGLKVSK